MSSKHADFRLLRASSVLVDFEWLALHQNIPKSSTIGNRQPTSVGRHNPYKPTMAAGDDDEEEALLSLSGYSTTNGLEKEIAQTLGLTSDQVTIVEVQGDDHVLFLVLGMKVGHIIERLNKNTAWTCDRAEMEEEVIIDEEEAYEIWQNMQEESRTSHLSAVPSPDGELVQPSHTSNTETDQDSIQGQLRRDPLLLKLDNVTRMKQSELDQANWEEPFIITGCLQDGHGSSNLLSKSQLTERLNTILVRTGNRNTLIESGFDNSQPLELGKAMETKGCVVFTPTKEMPSDFQKDLQELLDSFPSFPKTDNENQKHTLCIANQAGFGIGMHKHNAAFFFLVKGQKKWYMASSGFVTEPTHPAFYTTKSTHKCIQQPGEILYVPEQWYHEIFNLEYTAGFQALPE